MFFDSAVYCIGIYTAETTHRAERCKMLNAALLTVAQNCY